MSMYHNRPTIADVQTGEYPQPQHVVPIKDEEFEAFLKQVA